MEDNLNNTFFNTLACIHCGATLSAAPCSTANIVQVERNCKLSLLKFALCRDADYKSGVIGGAAHNLMYSAAKLHFMYIVTMWIKICLLRVYQNYHFNVAVETQNFASLQSGWINH